MRLLLLATLLTFSAVARADEQEDKAVLNGFSWGVSVAPVAEVIEKEAFKDLKIPSKTGVCVVGVNPYGVGAKGGIEPLTFIDVVNGERIRSTDDFMKVTGAIKPGERISVRAHLPITAGRQLKWTAKTLKGVARPRIEGLKEQAEVDRDAATGATTYRHKDTSEFVNERSEVYMDIVESDGKFLPRLGIRYVADGWLFIKNATLVINGKPFEVPLNGKTFQRDNKSTIWEWIVLTPKTVAEDDPLLTIMREMSQGGAVELVLNGQQYRKDRQLEDAERGRLTQMWWYYLALRSGAFKE